MQSAMEDGRFHFTKCKSSLPLLALYAEGSSNIQAENLLQSNANETRIWSRAQAKATASKSFRL